MSSIVACTRHEGSKNVIRSLLPDSLKNREIVFMPHVESIDDIDSDVVVGNLPTHLVRELTIRGIRFFNLTLDVPFELRGEDLSEDQVWDCNPRIEEYFMFSRRDLVNFLKGLSNFLK